jgi:hypothetical protein
MRLTEGGMSREIRFTKQYKPTGFGDGPDPGTVEAHRHATEEAAETRQYNRTMKELAAKREERQGRLLSKPVHLLGVFTSKSRRY